MKELDDLADQVALCTRCPLRATATQPVPGLGDGKKYFILGEAPGKDEDKAGVPFVGLAGRRLDKLIKLAGIDLKDCYITNVVKCRPPAIKGDKHSKNRAPRKAERLACYGWLRRELELVKPSYIITLGGVPLALFTEYGISQMHGTLFETKIDDMLVIIMAEYHPAAALHQPRLWAVMLDDWENMPEKVDASFTIADHNTGTSNLGIFALDTENAPDGSLGQWSLAYRDLDHRLWVKPFYGAKDIVNFNLMTNAQFVMHNAKWDLRVLDKAGMKRPRPENVVDTMIAAYCLGLGRQEPKDTGKSGDNLVGGLGLKYLARRHLGLEMKTWEEIKDRPDLVPEYNAMDSVATYLLFEKWKPELPQHFWDIDMPLLDVLMTIEDRGIKVDDNFLQEYAKAIDAELENIQLPLNPFSHKQVADYVYGTLGYPVTKKTGTGEPSVEKELLETIDDPIVRGILRYKEFAQEKKTYIGNYVNRLDLEGRLHGELKQTSTATGRLSSARPNLQNVAKDVEDRPSKLRSLFICHDGKLLVRVDWSQLELWTFGAVLSKGRLLETLLAGKDVHQETANFLEIPRSEAKNVNFLMLYGGGAWKISREFHVTVDKAKAMIARYYEAYPEIELYHKEQREKAETEHRVSNFYGRVRRLDAMFSEDWKTREEGVREAINTPIQGTAAEIVKRAMIRLHYDHHAPMLLQVHDELLFEIPKKDAKEYALWLKDYLPTLTEINGVTFPVDVSIGHNWLECMKKENKL